MGYRVVTVSPLKPFPIAYFGLANVVSLDDAKEQIRKRFADAGLAEIRANEAVQELGTKIGEASAVLANIESFPKKADAHKEEIEKIKRMIANLEVARKNITGPIREKHELAGRKEIAMLEERWAEGKIEPALKLHLARQEKRLAHFNLSCRVVGCYNPRRQKRGSGGERGTKANRPAVKPFFCGVHVGLRKCLTREMLDALHASSAKRVAIA